MSKKAQKQCIAAAVATARGLLLGRWLLQHHPRHPDGLGQREVCPAAQRLYYSAGTSVTQGTSVVPGGVEQLS